MNFSTDQLRELRDNGRTTFEAGRAIVIGTDPDGDLDVRVTLTGNCAYTQSVAKPDTVASVIMDQVGHRAFVMMGASNYNAEPDHLTWKVGRNAKKVTHITVTLDPSDTYTVRFQRATKRGQHIQLIDEVSMVYVDSLHSVIEAGTGFYLSL